MALELTLSSISTMFDTAYSHLERSFRKRVQEIEDSQTDLKKSAWYSSQCMLQLSPEQAKAFIEELKELENKYSQIKNREGQVFGLSLLFNPNYHIHGPDGEA